MIKLNSEDRLLFKKGKQREFLELASKNIGSLRKLAKFLNLGWGNFWYYLDERITLPYKLFKKIILLGDIKEEIILNLWVEKVLPQNWGRIKGGIKTGQKLRTDTKFQRKWKRIRKIAGKKIRIKYINNWDIGFRKIGKRNVIGPKSEKMFNEGERKIAQWLLNRGINYEYEKLIKLNNNFYFPDFLVGDIIIERCGFTWKNYIPRLKQKIEDYANYWNGKIIMVCPENSFQIIKNLININSKFTILREKDIDKMASMA